MIPSKNCETEAILTCPFNLNSVFYMISKRIGPWGVSSYHDPFFFRKGFSMTLEGQISKKKIIIPIDSPLKTKICHVENRKTTTGHPKRWQPITMNKHFVTLILL